MTLGVGFMISSATDAAMMARTGIPIRTGEPIAPPTAIMAPPMATVATMPAEMVPKRGRQRAVMMAMTPSTAAAILTPFIFSE